MPLLKKGVPSGYDLKINVDNNKIVQKSQQLFHYKNSKNRQRYVTITKPERYFKNIKQNKIKLNT